MLCYPRRRRTAGTLWIMLGILSVALKFERNADSVFGPISGLFMIGMGTWYVITYRHRDVRKKHVEYWPAKA